MTLNILFQIVNILALQFQHDTARGNANIKQKNMHYLYASFASSFLFD